jgi:hypothetical protein
MPPPHEQRITDALRGLDERIVRPELIQAWGSILSEADKHSLQVVLAGLHFLETPAEDGDERSGTPKRIFGFSDNDVATWLRQGTYRGADPLAESSPTKAAEKRRAARTLTHLGQAGAAFHDRRLWTPTPAGKRTSRTHRLWIINPLLAIHHRVAERPITPASSGTPPQPRPRPTHRNRKTNARS